MKAYYNEFDPYAAQWLRNLIQAGHIAPGIVDERSIEDICPADLAGFTQCHFFAGVGVWSLALRRAGWGDTRPVWTGSCPCQPFSAAGKGAGFDDERHLWPAFHHLIAECRPAIVLGEQVASGPVGAWIDLVHADLEALGYAFGGIPFPSAGVGAPHIRDRLYWMADAQSTGAGGQPRGVLGSTSAVQGASSGQRYGDAAWPDSTALRLADPDGRNSSAERQQRSGEQRQQPEDGGAGRMADAIMQQRPDGQPAIGNEYAAPGRQQGTAAIAGLCDDLRPSPTNGQWRDADWLGCTDGRWRPVEPGTFPLVASTPAKLGSLRAGWDAPAGQEGQGHRAGRLKGYGNAINAEAARVFIESVMEVA